MIRSTSEWERILRESGVRLVVAEQWAIVFAATIHNETFSKGDEDLKDFLATILHESQMLEKLKENGNYSADRIRQLGNASRPGSRWRSLVDKADDLAHNPDAFFEAVYGGRMGNDEPGDGALYPGRGLIGVTGKDNYRWLGDRGGQDLLSNPTLLEQPFFALELSIEWWEGKVPDSILGDESKVRRIVNGGDFGLSEIRILLTRIERAMA